MTGGRRRLALPVALTVATLGALAAGCPASNCADPPPCEDQYVLGADGGVAVVSRYADGAVTDAGCPPPPPGCPAA